MPLSTDGEYELGVMAIAIDRIYQQQQQQILPKGYVTITRKY